MSALRRARVLLNKSVTTTGRGKGADTIVPSSSLGVDPQDPPERSHDALVVPLSNYQPPAHVICPMEPPGDQLSYFQALTVYHTHSPMHKYDWKPRMLATLWVHSIAPHEWAPRTWMNKRGFHSIGYYDFVRNFANIELWSAWMYMAVFTIMISGTALWMFFRHPNMDYTRPHLGWHFIKPYYVADPLDSYDYRCEGGPYGIRGGGKFQTGRYRVIDRFDPQFKIFGQKLEQNQVGPAAEWSIADAFRNEYARSPHRL